MISDNFLCSMKSQPPVNPLKPAQVYYFNGHKFELREDIKLKMTAGQQCNMGFPGYMDDVVPVVAYCKGNPRHREIISYITVEGMNGDINTGLFRIRNSI